LSSVQAIKKEELAARSAVKQRLIGQLAGSPTGWLPAGIVKEIWLNFTAPEMLCKLRWNPPKRVSIVWMDTNLYGRVRQQLHDFGSAEVAPHELPLFASVIKETVVRDPVPWSLPISGRS
jgi:hypothetical protein